MKNIQQRHAGRGLFTEKSLSALLPVLLLVVVASITLFAFVPRSMAAGVPMEVYQQEGRKIFGQVFATDLDIFDDSALGGDKIIAPFSGGSYEFAVFNNSVGDLLPYTIDIVATNAGNLPIVASLERNGAFVFGGPGSGGMLPFDEINISERFLTAGQTDNFTLHWAWRTESDVADTAIGNDGTQTYTLTITATGTVAETEEEAGGPSGPTTAPSVTRPGANRPGLGTDLGRTGDGALSWLWLVIALLGTGLIIWVLFDYRDNDKADDKRDAISRVGKGSNREDY